MSESSHSEAGGSNLDRPWVIVGCGSVGRALGYAALGHGIALRATWNRTERAAEETARSLNPELAASGPLRRELSRDIFRGSIVWLTVVDDALEEVARELADSLDEAHVVLHAAGALESSLLREAGVSASVGSLHPLLAVTDPKAAAEKFGSVAWSVEGDPASVDFASRFTEALGAHLVELPAGGRALYHASAVSAANLFVALADAALEMAEQSGLGREEAREMLLPLMRSSLENLESTSVEEALSGPVARGDERTIERHLEALEESHELERTYRLLTDRARSFGEPED
jgi:predicted short-subunit dehydrogenase-like oxidoreductase (DUF2520 family)